jgi:hypothetical protein
MTADHTRTDRLQEFAAKLSVKSRKNSYDPYELFEWPDSLSTSEYWMAPELMTCYGTSVWNELTEDQRLALSHREFVNFLSLNIHQIREIISEVVDRIYETRFPGLSEFFYDFIAEENKHMWFFATFCHRYGGRVYPRGMSFPAGSDEESVLRDILVFGRILIAEEVADAFNIRMAEDKRLPPLVQQINRVHHRDESRHLAFGRQLMRALTEQAAATTGEKELRAAGDYLARYTSVVLQLFYNPAVYTDAGIEGGRQLRARLLEDPVRQQTHRELMNRTMLFLERLGLGSMHTVAP